MREWQIHWKDYYKILEVSETATFDEIKTSYRRLMSQYHPDSSLEDNNLARDINEAYSVLSSASERELYDLDYIKNKQKYSSINPEDIEKDYKEVEIKLAKQLALRQQIDIQLEKLDLVLNAKMEIIYSVFDDNINNEIFYNQAKEYNLIIDNYICDLVVHLDKAKELDMYNEVETLNGVINELIEIADNLPTSIEEAKKTIYTENKKEMLISITNECENIIKYFDQFFISLCDREVSKMEYEQIYELLLLKLKDSLVNLEHCLKLIKDHKLEIEVPDKLISKIHSYLVKLDYDSAVLIGRKLLLKESVKKSIGEWMPNKNKVYKIIKIVKKYPKNHHSYFLRNYAREIIDESYKHFKELCEEYNVLLQGENNEYYAKDLSEKAIKMFEKTSKNYDEAKTIFENKLITEGSLTYKDIAILAKGALESLDKNMALEVLEEASDIIAFLETTTILHDSEFNEVYDNFVKEKYQAFATQCMFNEFEQKTDQVISILDKYKININDLSKLEKKRKRLRAFDWHMDKYGDLYYAIVLTFLIFVGGITGIETLVMLFVKHFYKSSLYFYSASGALVYLKKAINNYDDSKLRDLTSDIYKLELYKK